MSSRIVRYAKSIEKLRKARTDLNIVDLMGTKEGVEALIRFLRKSCAFTKTGAPPTTALKPSTENKEVRGGDAAGGVREWDDVDNEGSLEGSEEEGEEGDERHGPDTVADNQRQPIA
jgi:hypothetical protein